MAKQSADNATSQNQSSNGTKTGGKSATQIKRIVPDEIMFLLFDLAGLLDDK